ncbi:sulfatase-like hydrolase/transferase [bacterium]|nr:sulfatase-like hydrolase/transferase [bacterium]
MIFADDLGYGDIESPPFNQQHIRTPHLRAMAQSGLTFENFYSGAAWCPPARNTLMSGKHSGNTFYDNQAPNSWVIWSPDKLLPAMMQEAGYRTGVIGKWGMSSFTSDRNPTDPNLWPGNPEFGLPEEVGFDEFYGFLNHTDAHLYLLDSPATPAQATPYQPYFGVGSHRNASGALVAPLGKRQNLYHIEDGKTVEYSPRFPMTKFTQDEFLERADTFITENRDSPFFLYLPWTIPHAELYLPPSDPAWNYYQGVSFQDSVYFGDQNPVNTWPYLRRVDEPRKTYAAMISRLDRDVKTILDRLAAEGLLDNTLVIFTSDNGPHNASGMRRDDPNDTFSFDSAGGYRGRKGALYEGGIKVPFIVHLPERMRGAHQGTIRSDLAALWDIYPTIAELIEVDLPAAMELDGTSLLPAFEGGQTLERDFLYWENANRAGAPIDFISDSIQAVRKGKWKLVRIDKAGPDDFLLYDLENDPMESTDVAPVSNNCTVVNELKEIMRSEREPVPGGANAWKNPINLNEIVLEYCPPRLDISVNPQRARFEITHLPFQEINWTNTSLLMNGGEVLPDLIAAASSPLVDIQVDEQRGTATIEVFVDLTGQQFDFISCSTESGTGLQRCNQIRHP